MDDKPIVAKKTKKRLTKKQLVEKRCREILNAAKHVFAEKGFRCTKIDDIAAYLKVGKGTIYRYFNDKQALFIGVFEDGMQQLLGIIYSNIESAAGLAEKIRTAVRTYFEFFDANPELVEIAMQVRSEFKDEYRRIFMALYQDYIVRIQNNLRAGIAQGIFRQMDVEKTADAMSATTQGVLQGFYIREFAGGASVKEKLIDRTDAVAQLLLEGLLKREDGKN